MRPKFTMSTPAVYVASAATTLLVSIAACEMAYGVIPMPALFAAWLLTMANSVAAMWITNGTTRGNSHRPVMWGLGLSGARALGVFTVVLVAYVSGLPHFHAFLLALGCGYFIFLLTQVAVLHARLTQPEIIHP